MKGGDFFMGKLFYFIITIVAFLGITIADTKAQTVDFEITTNSVWKYDKDMRSSTKNTENKYTAVGWNTSTRLSHKMWFRVIDGSDNVKGSMLFDYVTANAFLTKLELNHSYWLQARRENWWDPITTVTGIWNA